MGILEDVFFHLFDGPEIGGRKGRKLLERGSRAPATITGILVTRTQVGEHSSDTNDFVFAYALDVRAPGGDFRAGVRQRVDIQRWRAHVGAEVVVAYDDGGVIIDWGASFEAWGLGPAATNTHSWKVFDEPPPAGVTDRNVKPIPADEAAEAVVVADRGATMLGLKSVETRVVDLEVRLRDGQVVQRRVRVNPPDYASVFLRPGVVVRAGYDSRKDRVRLDWLALANEPLRTVEVPAWRGEPEPQAREYDPMAIAARITGAFNAKVPDFEAAASAPPPAGAVHGATFDRWLELKAQMEVAGVGRKQRDAWATAREPAVTSWKDLDRHWSKAMGTDPELAARWGALWPQAVSDAMSARGASTRIG